jgi:hypothetical protein
MLVLGLPRVRDMSVWGWLRAWLKKVAPGANATFSATNIAAKVANAVTPSNTTQRKRAGDSLSGPEVLQHRPFQPLGSVVVLGTEP